MERRSQGYQCRELAGLDAGPFSATDGLMSPQFWRGRDAAGRDVAGDVGRCAILKEKSSTQRRESIAGSAQLRRRGVRLVSRGLDWGKGTRGES